MPENSEIIRTVKEGLDRLNEIECEGTRESTKVTKTKLCMLGRSFGYKVYAKDVEDDEKDGGEWLYDVTWLEYEKSGDGELTDAPLVAECEWQQQGIEDDFEKLLLARARVRVMIVDAGTDRTYSKKIAKLLAGKVKKFKDSRDDDAWLLAVVEQSDDDWSFRYFDGCSLQELKH